MSEQAKNAEKYLRLCEMAAARTKKCYHNSGGKEKKAASRAAKKRVEAVVVEEPQAPQQVVIRRRRQGVRYAVEEVAPPPPPIVVAPREVIIKRPKSHITFEMVMQFLDRPFEEVGFTSEGSRIKCIRDITAIFRIIKCKYFEQFVKQFDNIKKLIENAKMANGEQYSLNSRAGYFYAIRWIYTHMKLNIPEDIKTKYNTLLAVYSEKSLIQTKKKKESADKSVLPQADYVGKIEHAFGKDSKEYLVVQLYLQVPCRDNLYLKVVPTLAEAKKDVTRNYAIVPRGKGLCKVILNVYKTSLKYKDLTFDLDSSLSQLIRSWIAKNGIAEGSTIFKDKSLSSFVSKMNKKINIEGSINYLRHMIISNQNIENMSIEELHEKAALSGHSIQMHRDYCRSVLAKS